MYKWISTFNHLCNRRGGHALIDWQGWEQSVTPEGEVYFIHHVTKRTTWYDPRIPIHAQVVPQKQGQESALSQVQVVPVVHLFLRTVVAFICHNPTGAYYRSKPPYFPPSPLTKILFFPPPAIYQYYSSHTCFCRCLCTSCIFLPVYLQFWFPSLLSHFLLFSILHVQYHTFVYKTYLHLSINMKQTYDTSDKY
jgi:hypothetical protein